LDVQIRFNKLVFCYTLLYLLILKVAVTGASGHVGSNLIRALIKQGHHVKALFYKDSRGFNGLEIETIKGDLMDKNSLHQLFDDCEIVFHLAAQISISGDKSGHVFNTNVKGTENVVNVCKDIGIKRLIHFSSIHALSQFPLNQVLDESRFMVKDSKLKYDYSKALSELVVLDAVKDGLDAVILNPTSIVGPYDFKPSLVGSAILRIFNRQLPALVPGGYDWVDVRDVADAAISAMNMGRSGERYIISGGWKSLLELGNIIKNQIHIEPPKVFLPTWIAYLGLPFLNVFAHLTKSSALYTKDSLYILGHNNKLISNAKACKELNYHPRPIETTLLDSYNWFKENNYLK
jgi:dihydroflavonol-4-reductase